MRREHYKSQSYIDWLKSLGCVFYAPLIQGDTKDYISGQPMTIIDGTVSWDNGESAYKFYGPTSLNSYIANWQGLDMNLDINNLAISYLFEVKGNNSNIVPICLGGRQFTTTSIATGYTNTWFKYATAMSNISPRTQWWFTNGNVSTTFPNGYNRGNNPIVVNPTAKSNVECNSSGSYSYILNTTLFMRNAMIFNRALTQDEIRQIQQI